MMEASRIKKELLEKTQDRSRSNLDYDLSLGSILNGSSHISPSMHNQNIETQEML
jgi:hypothetical protein